MGNGGDTSTIMKGTVLGTRPASAGYWEEPGGGSPRRWPEEEDTPPPRDVPIVPPNRPIVDLMGSTEPASEPSELELDDVVITNPHIEAILENEDWVEDAS